MRNIPIVTKNLLIVNVVAFLACMLMDKSMGGGSGLTDMFGLHFFLASDFHIYQLVTYMFMHGGFQHILFNMFALWMFGCVVERVWGPKKFLFYYIALEWEQVCSRKLHSILPMWQRIWQLMIMLVLMEPE